LNAFPRKKTSLFIYVCSCPFSDNSKVTDLVKVYKGLKIFPKHSNGDYVWFLVERVPSSPQATYTIDALYSSSGKGKRSKYFTSFMPVNSEYLWKNILKVYHTEVKF